MALSSAQHERIHNKTGSDLAAIKANFDNGKHLEVINFPVESAIIYQIQKMQEELDYLRTEISANKDKATFPGFGTSGTTALVGNTALLALGTSGSTALAGDTKIVSYVGSSDTNITIGNMASAIVKGQTVYTLPITVTQTGTDKLGNPTTLTKTATLNLA